MMKKVLGIDIGGTGIKGGIVDLDNGTMVSDRYKLETPPKSGPEQMLPVIKQIIEHFNWNDKPIGFGFPSVIKNGISLTASNISNKWIGYPIKKYFEENLDNPLSVVNDADAAGLAEITYGEGKGVSGTVILLTLGTGIGSSIFKDGKLLHNTELGHLKYKGNIAEKVVSNAAKKKRDLSWDEYGKELHDFLDHINKLFYPDLIILGGGISKKYQKYSKTFDKITKVTPASQFNNAGIIGAALAYTS